MSFANTRIEEIARACHEANRGYCAALGDHSQPSWFEAPMWMRQSAINGVKFALANPQVTPEQSHESWLAEKRAAGWTWGPVKDASLKQHPCFVPYAELPVEQRAKDHIFLGVVRGMR